MHDAATTSTTLNLTLQFLVPTKNLNCLLSGIVDLEVTNASVGGDGVVREKMGITWLRIGSGNSPGESDLGRVQFCCLRRRVDSWPQGCEECSISETLAS